jgi:Protein of unknown function (DUF2946)
MRRKLIAGILLFAFASRALVPMGFMPAMGHAFPLQICPDGFPPQLLHRGIDHKHGAYGAGGSTHHHDSSVSDHCAFAAVTGAPPAANTPAVPGSFAGTQTALFDTTRSIYRTQRFRIQQPRGPPLPA